MSFIDKLIEDANIETALLYLRDKKDTCGSDGLRVSQLNDYLTNNKTILIDLLKSNSYKVSEVVLSDLLSKNGKIRTIAKINSIDKLVLRMIYQIIEPIISSLFQDNSFAYRKDKGVVNAVLCMKDYLTEGYSFVLNVDIKKYFDNINHNILYCILIDVLKDNDFVNLIFKFIKVNIKKDFKKYVLSKGLLQGSILSPLLSNLYLTKLDTFFKDNNIKYIRYADDIRIFAKSFNDICSYKEKLLIEIKKFDLSINEKKSSVIDCKLNSPVFLGYEFIKVEKINSYEIKKLTRTSNYEHYSLWNSSPLCVTNDEYHIVSDGILTQEDYNLIFENDNKKELIVLNNIDTINIYSNVIFSKRLFELFYKRKMTVSIYNKYDCLLGTFVPTSIDATTVLSIEQLKFYIDDSKRMYIAKQFVIAAGHNLNENLKYYLKHNKNDKLNEAIIKISALIKQENECTVYNNLLSLEGNVRIIYYSCINYIINSDSFDFKNRNRRPPLDPINALISYGNTILYSYVAKKIYKSKLDIRIGFLHATNKRRESLNLDISEIFRPILVDKIIFSLINRHEIKEDIHFKYIDNACYLNDLGRKIFIQAFENKMFSKIKIDNKYYTYSDLIMNEIYKLCNHIKGIKKYKAYKYFM